MVESKMPDCCEACKIYRNEDCTNPHIEMWGDRDAEVLFVGEAPGFEEDLKKTPFVGRSGKVLRKAIENSGAKYKYAFTNIIKCRPKGNSKPKMFEVNQCWGFFEEELKSLPNLKVIVIIGNIALRAICGYEGILTKTGTQVKSSKLPHYHIYILMHPAYILRNQSKLRDFNEHVSRIPNVIANDLTDYTQLGNYLLITNDQLLNTFRNNVYSSGTVYYDIETTGLDPYDSDSSIKCIQFSTGNNDGWIFPFTDIDVNWDPNFNRILAEEQILDILKDPGIKKVGHNIKFDNIWMEVKKNCRVQGTSFDTEIGQFLINENTSLSLKMMAWRYTKLGGYEEYFLKGVPVEQAEGMSLYKYGACDADVTGRIAKKIMPQVEGNPKLNILNNQILIPTIEILKDMEIRGIRIDTPLVEDSKTLCENIISDIEDNLNNFYSVKKFVKLSGLKFNPNSDAHLREILFKYEKLRPRRYTEKKREPSVDKSLLEYYSDNKLCSSLKDYNSYVTFKTKTLEEILTYTVGGRLHTNYRVCDATSGRTSSKNPNLQNVPKGPNDRTKVRRAFRADPDFYLVEPDYNQHELRIMATLSNDINMINALKGDVHTETTSSILNIPADKVTKEQRRDIGKVLNFGIIYGMTAAGLAMTLNISNNDADSYITKFFSRYYGIKKFMKDAEDFIRKNHYIETVNGRVRHLPIIEEEEHDVHMIRQGINMLVQSPASDILLCAMIGITKFFKKYRLKSFLTLQVHDCIVLNIHKDELGVLHDIKNIMTTYYEKIMNFKVIDVGVDFHIGENWGEMEEIKI